MPNYVKFQRGSEQAYNNLAVKSQDTLYFIYDAADPKTGKLYLGDRLLSGVGQGTGVTSLSQLEEVLILGTPSAGSFLVYRDGKWVNQSLEAVAALIAAESSLGLKIDSKQFKFNVATQELELIGFSDAANGAMTFKGTDGALTWGTPPIVSNISGKLDDLTTNLESIIDDKISQINHLTFKKVEDLSLATDENIVYLIPNENSTIKNEYQEYLVVDGEPELLGSVGLGEVNLDGYTTKEEFNVFKTEFITVVGDITKLTNYNAENPQTIIDELNSINERLKWEDIPV